MIPGNIRRIQDAMAKLNARNKLVSGGTQYAPDVSLMVGGVNKGKAMLRNKKAGMIKPVSLRKLQQGF